VRTRRKDPVEVAIATLEVVAWLCVLGVIASSFVLVDLDMNRWRHGWSWWVAVSLAVWGVLFVCFAFLTVIVGDASWAWKSTVQNQKDLAAMLTAEKRMVEHLQELLREATGDPYAPRR
jgi:hypothetical protein